jgi:hypothetical protein
MSRRQAPKKAVPVLPAGALEPSESAREWTQNSHNKWPATGAGQAGAPFAIPQAQGSSRKGEPAPPNSSRSPAPSGAPCGADEGP